MWDTAALSSFAGHRLLGGVPVQPAEEADELLPVVLHHVVVVVHHDGHGLADDERHPDAQVARPRAHLPLQPVGDEDERDLQQGCQEIF